MAVAAGILDQVMELPPQEREDLAVRILLSLADGPNRPLSKEEFEATLCERIEQVERGDMETVDAFEALEKARERIRRRLP